MVSTQLCLCLCICTVDYLCIRFYKSKLFGINSRIYHTDKMRMGRLHVQKNTYHVNFQYVKPERNVENYALNFLKTLPSTYVAPK